MTDIAPNAAAFPGVAPRLFEMMQARGLAGRVLTVAGAEPVTPRMRRVSLTGEALADFEPRPGQDMVLMLPDGPEGLGRRHYSIRRFDPAGRRLDIDVVLHSEASPGARWALHATPGQEVLTFGPRGRNVIHPGADWRLFVGDESTIPPVFAMLESLPAGARARAFLEVQSDEDRQALRTEADVELVWLSRGGAAAQASSPALIGAVEGFELPPGVGHAYLLGETSTIRRQRHDLIARGLPKEQIFGEGYWRPGRIGGHDHLVEH
jgi:NADPH-dependent ferric siderophore reductase